MALPQSIRASTDGPCTGPRRPWLVRAHPTRRRVALARHAPHGLVSRKSNTASCSTAPGTLWLGIKHCGADCVTHGARFEVALWPGPGPETSPRRQRNLSCRPKAARSRAVNVASGVRGGAGPHRGETPSLALRACMSVRQIFTQARSASEGRPESGVAGAPRCRPARQVARVARYRVSSSRRIAR
jgi:hypothetical protein